MSIIRVRKLVVLHLDIRICKAEALPYIFREKKIVISFRFQVLSYNKQEPRTKNIELSNRCVAI